MTRQLDSTSPVDALDPDDLVRLARIPDEEQRAVVFRELLRRHGRSGDYTDLSIAENALVYPLLKERVFSTRPHPLPEKATRYVSPHDTERLATAMAGHLAASFGAPVAPRHVYATAGVASALEIIALALQHPAPDGEVPVPRGSNVLIPAPYWQGFNWSFQEVPGLTCVPVPTYKSNSDAFELTVEDLDKSYHACAQPPRLLVLTNPHNPLGGNYSPELLDCIYDWALTKTPRMHIVSDEMYRHSQLPHTSDRFVSALSLMDKHAAADRVHVVWGFAKDFGLSGFRAGFIVSRSPNVRQVMADADDPLERMRPLSWFSQFDSLKHFYIDPITTLSTSAWKDLMTEYSANLQVTFRAVCQALDQNGIRYHRPPGTNSAQFFWLDLREFLHHAPPARESDASVFKNPPTGPTDPELALAAYLLSEAKVKLLTGSTMYQLDPQGFYRLCFTAAPPAKVLEAVENLCAALRKLTPSLP